MGLSEERIYYDDSQCTSFVAVVVEQVVYEDKWYVRLDRTAFYPTSGGQPNDIGSLRAAIGSLPEAIVSDVMVQDGHVFHLVDKPFQVEERVQGEVDWNRRFDHMQQHCGQHILSRCFETLLNIDTIGFHLGEEWVTLDLQAPSLSWGEVEKVEWRANQIIWEDRKVSALFVTPQELASLHLRHEPKVAQDIRIVRIEDFDDNPCGGTHPASTGQVGQIKVVRMEKMHGGVRLTFVCGTRALLDNRKKQSLMRDLCSSLSTGSDELLEVVVKLQMQVQNLRKHELSLKETLADLLAEKYVQASELNNNRVRVISAMTDGFAVKDLKSLANAIVRRLSTGVSTGVSTGPYAIVLFCADEERIHVQLTVSSDSSLDANDIVKRVLMPFEGKGGGSRSSAQGSLPKWHPETGVDVDLESHFRAALL